MLAVNKKTKKKVFWTLNMQVISDIDKKKETVRTEIQEKGSKEKVDNNNDYPFSNWIM